MLNIVLTLGISKLNSRLSGSSTDLSDWHGPWRRS